MRRPRGVSAGAVLVLAVALCATPSSAVVGDDAAPKPPLGPPGDLSAGSYLVMLGDRPPVVTSQVSQAFRVAFPRARATAAAGPASLPAAAREGAAADVERYSAQLRSSHDAALAAVATAAAGGAAISRHFTFAVNAFSVAGLTKRQAAVLAAQPNVMSVEPVRRLTTRTYSTPEYLGLSGAGGLWDLAFNGTAKAGAGTLIGVIDTGITPAAASFASIPRSGSRWDAGGPSGACNEAGTCTAGKLVGCQFFEAGFNALLKKYYPNEVREPTDISTCIDKNGHGSHTSSTAGGDFGARAVLNDVLLSPSGMSGMAPGAAVAMYKVMWSSYNRNAGPAETYVTGFDEDILAAVEAAIKDGVDVINYSIGGDIPKYWWKSAIFEAYRSAAIAGILVSAAAGNDGPEPGTADNTMPWITTVAAGTHARQVLADATLVTSVGATTATGTSASGTGLPAAPIFWAGAAGGNAALCIANALDPGAVTGRVVFCLRGTNNRMEKSAEVKRAGGVGMVLINVATLTDTTFADAHTVPTIHLKVDEGNKLLAAYNAAPAGATVSLGVRYIKQSAEAPFVASFSSRGPSPTDNSVVLKPDILAPGVDIFAVVAGLKNNETGESLSGTSMATPHIAGIAALVMDKHPTWSPAAVKSALMTTASQVTNKGNPIKGDPHAYGAGHVNPAAALDPGLVYDAGETDYQVYSCAMMQRKAWKSRWTKKPKRPAFCATACGASATTNKKGGKCAYPQAVRDLNMPSFSLPGFKPGSRATRTMTARRTVTYVGDGPAAFKADLQLPTGFTGAVAADGGGGAMLAFTKSGEKASFNLTVTVSKAAPKKAWSFGSLTWTSDGGRWKARSPIALQRP